MKNPMQSSYVKKSIGLYKIIGQPPQPWPIPCTDCPASQQAAQQNALDYLTKQLCTTCVSIREKYHDADTDGPTLADDVNAVEYPSPPVSTFTAQDLADLKTQLLAELDLLPWIQKHKVNVSNLWTANEININSKLTSVSATVQSLPCCNVSVRRASARPRRVSETRRSRNVALSRSM